MSRIVDGLLEALPQEAVAGIKITGEVNGRTFISCRLDPAENSPSIQSLTPRQYEVLMLVSESMTYAIIAEDLGITIPTAADHLANISDKLAVRGLAQVASYIPLNEYRLREIPFYWQSADEATSPRLAQIHAQVIEYIAAGLTNRQIAGKLQCANGTARAYRSQITNKLNLGAPLSHEGIGLRRYAGAMINLTTNYLPMIANAANIVQPEIVSMLQTEQGPVDLAHVVALLMEKPGCRALLEDDSVRHIAYTVIQQEVRLTRRIEG